MTDNKKVILVVDDEQHQLDTVCRGLFLYGFQCEGALNVSEAIRILESNPNKYSLVLTDLTMPDHSGLELIEQIASRWPSLALMVITGLADTPDLEKIQERNIPVLQKPFQPDRLSQMIEKQLRSAG